MRSFKLVVSGTAQGFSYDEYTLGGIPVSDTVEWIGTASAGVSF